MTDSVKWKSIATGVAATFLAAVVAGAGIVSIIPKSVEFKDVKIMDVRSERRPFGLGRTTRYEMVVEFPDGKIVEIPANKDITGRVGETVRVKVVESFLGGYNIYVSE